MQIVELWVLQLEQELYVFLGQFQSDLSFHF